MKKIFIFLLAFTVTMGVTVYSDAALWDRGGRPHLKPTDLSMSLSNAENQNISKEDQNKIKEVFGQRPISFIENRGQLDSRVKYYAKQGGSTIYFTENEIVFDFVRQKKNAGIQEKNLLFPGKAHEINKLKNIEMERQVIRMKLEQANPHPEILANNKQKGIVNYIIGNDPSKWRTNIPTFSIVYYKDVYAGIDLRFYASAQGSLEYDFIVHPGADPNKIMVAMEGIKRMEQDDKGDLHIWTGWGEIRQKSPKMFQTVDGKKIEVTGKFQITNNTKKSNQQTSLLASYGFKLGNYDKHHKVVVDPVIVYSTYLVFCLVSCFQ